MYGSQNNSGMSTTKGSGNPFRMPTDEEVFLLRDEERRLRQEGKQQHNNNNNNNTTNSSSFSGGGVRATAASTSYVSPYPTRAEPKPPNPLSVYGSLKSGRGGGGGGVGASAAASGVPQLPSIDTISSSRERETMTTYIQKKREMGLARMSLATKRMEIKKLEEDADRSEKRLRQQQEQLQNTHSKFNDFLRQSNMEQDAAVRRADIETKAKQEKMQEVKKLNGHILLIEIEKKKTDEQMEQCAEYKAFLDKLTPIQWFRETLANLLIEDERAIIAVDLERQLLEQINDSGEVTNDHEEQLLGVLNARVSAATSQITELVGTLSDTEVQRRLDIIDAQTGRVPMYFTNPQQILDIFQDTEESNLFLIQNCQDLDEQLEGVSQKYQSAQAQMVRTAQRGKTQMEQIMEKIANEQNRRKQLSERIDRTRQVGSGMTQEQLKTEIEEKVQRILRDTTIPGIGDVSNLDTLGMLTAIETRLEELHHIIVDSSSGIDDKFATAVMKERDRARRHDARTLALQKAALERELRSQQALRRSQGPTEKRVGKPVMWRSRPLDAHKLQATQSTSDNTYNEDDEFLM